MDMIRCAHENDNRHSRRTVPPRQVRSRLAWAQAEGPRRKGLAARPRKREGARRDRAETVAAPQGLAARPDAGSLRDHRRRAIRPVHQSQIFRRFRPMKSGILLDTGPLVAYLHRRDAHHDWAVETFDGLDSPVITCEPVLSEACFLVARTNLP